MGRAFVNGVNLYFELHGNGFPLVWCHESCGDYRSWALQVECFARHYRVVTYNDRGYPPSDVPADPSAYSQNQSVADVLGLLDHLGIQQAHVGGLSKGGNIALNFGLAHPARTRSLIIAGTGTGSNDPAAHHQRGVESARLLGLGGMDAILESETTGDAARLPLRRKHPHRWREFVDLLRDQSPIGRALTARHVTGPRPSIFALGEKLRGLDVPTLIMVGDEDEPCMEPAIFMKRCISRSGLVVFPQSGHTLNLEEPEMFNRTVLEFLVAVESDKWARRSAYV